MLASQGPKGYASRRMHAFDVAHAVAAITIGLVVVRGLQAVSEHYFPNTEPVAVLRFIFGGP